MLTSRWYSRSVTRLRKSVSPVPPPKRKCSHRMLPEIRRSFRNTKKSRFHTEAMASLRRESERKCIGVVPLDPRRRGVRTFRGLNCSTDTFGYRCLSNHGQRISQYGVLRRARAGLHCVLRALSVAPGLFDLFGIHFTTP